MSTVVEIALASSFKLFGTKQWSTRKLALLTVATASLRLRTFWWIWQYKGASELSDGTSVLVVCVHVVLITWRVFYLCFFASSCVPCVTLMSSFSFEIANYLNWYLMVEVEDKRHGTMFSRVHASLVAQLSAYVALLRC